MTNGSLERIPISVRRAFEKPGRGSPNYLRREKVRARGSRMPRRCSAKAGGRIAEQAFAIAIYKQAVFQRRLASETQARICADTPQQAARGP